MQFAIVKTL